MTTTKNDGERLVREAAASTRDFQATWKIIKVDDENFTVTSPFGDEVRARIMEVKGTWIVTFPDAPAFNFHCSTMNDGFDRCVGYVRGIERASIVHANETRAAKRERGAGR